MALTPEPQEEILQRKFENPQKVIQEYVQFKVRENAKKILNMLLVRQLN